MFKGMKHGIGKKMFAFSNKNASIWMGCLSLKIQRKAQFLAEKCETSFLAANLVGKASCAANPRLLETE